jgi:pSer/pThr/pTyr-binding forkhead associated (FHA) protein
MSDLASQGSAGRLTIEWNGQATRPVLVRFESDRGAEIESSSDALLVVVGEAGLRCDGESLAVATFSRDGWVVSMSPLEVASSFEERELAAYEVPSIEIEEPGGGRQTYRIELEDGERLVVGRGGSDVTCDLEIADTRMSAIHFEIRIVSGELFIQDLESRHGTRVNGNPISRRHRLRHLDQIRAGTTTLTVRHPIDELQGDTLLPAPVPPPLPISVPPSVPNPPVADAQTRPSGKSRQSHWARTLFLAILIFIGFAVFALGAVLLIQALNPETFGLGGSNPS